MTFSLNELEVEAKKAIRGAGLPWGLAEDGGKAARWLAAHGVDPLPALNDVLARHDRGENIGTAFASETSEHWQADASICPIILGAALCDHADRLMNGAITAGPVARPLLLVPFAAAAARLLSRPVRLDVNGMQIVLSEHGDPSIDPATLDVADAPQIRCEIAERVPEIRLALTRGLAPEPQLWAQITAFGHRTYVPASERSRREGAGAGMIDND